MTTHELAAKLLECPNVPVRIHDYSEYGEDDTEVEWLTVEDGFVEVDITYPNYPYAPDTSPRIRSNIQVRTMPIRVPFQIDPRLAVDTFNIKSGPLKV